MTPAQLKQRRKYIGGSEIAAIMGLSPFQTASGLYDEKLGLVEPKPTSDAMLTGIYLEDGIAKLWAHRRADKLGTDIVLRKHRPKVHPEFKFMRASPDRIVHIGREGVGFTIAQQTVYSGQLVQTALPVITVVATEGLEVKCISAYSEAAGGWGRSGSKDYPEYYKAQCAWNRMIFDLPRWNLVALTADGRYTIKHYVYEADLVYEQSLRDAACDFWFNHVQKKIRPAEKPVHRLTSPDVPDILKTIEAPPTWAATL